jgi:hypothetical protein
MGKRLLVGSWSRKRGVTGPDEAPQPLNEGNRHSYLLSGVVCASEVHKEPSSNLRGRLEHHGHWTPRRIGSGLHGRADSHVNYGICSVVQEVVAVGPWCMSKSSACLMRQSVRPSGYP